MTDKEKQYLIAEIERLKDCASPIVICDTLLSFIDSLQEEPVSKQKLSNVERTVKNWKEPVSEELEQAAKKYGTKKHPMTTIGANESAHDFKAGADWQKEQMMAKTIDAHVNYAWSSLSFGGFDWSKTGLDIGDKCKLIIIKEN